MLLHAFPLEYSSSNYMPFQVNWTSQVVQPLLATRDLELVAFIASEITRPLEEAGLRALYLAERVRCQLVGKDDPQILMDPLEFMLAPYSMTDAKYNSWGSGVPYTGQLLEGLDYERFNITRLMPSLTAQVYAQSFLLLLFSVSLFVMTSNVGNCNRGDLLPISLLTLHISLGRSMLLALMALLGSMPCPVILMSWTILSLPTLKR